ATVRVRRRGASPDELAVWARSFRYDPADPADEPHVIRRVDRLEDEAREWLARYEDTGRPVGVADIAERLGTTRNTVESWRRRDHGFPEPDWTVGGRPAWRWGAVREWAERTGRLR